MSQEDVYPAEPTDGTLVTSRSPPDIHDKRITAICEFYIEGKRITRLVSLSPTCERATSRKLARIRWTLVLSGDENINKIALIKNVYLFILRAPHKDTTGKDIQVCVWAFRSLSFCLRLMGVFMRFLRVVLPWTYCLTLRLLCRDWAGWPGSRTPSSVPNTGPWVSSSTYVAVVGEPRWTKDVGLSSQARSSQTRTLWWVPWPQLWNKKDMPRLFGTDANMNVLLIVHRWWTVAVTLRILIHKVRLDGGLAQTSGLLLPNNCPLGEPSNWPVRYSAWTGV